MDVRDVIYLSSLLFSICFGPFYRTIKDRNVKKNVGTAIGMFLVLIVAQAYIIHLLATTFVNALIILYIDKRRCHLVSFTFSFFYLTIFRSFTHFDPSNGSIPTNFAQMILTLKLVGLALEVNTTYTTQNGKDTEKSEEQKDKDEANAVDPTFLDIFHYAFNYVGVITGPYYRYRTFMDHLNYPFAEYDNWKQTAFNTLKFIPLYAVIFLLVTNTWPITYTGSEEFYERSWLYRYWYIWPTFLKFRVRLYVGLLLASSACITAGLGAYPSFTKPRPGQGPTRNFSGMKKLLSGVNLSDNDFDFTTVQNINPYQAEFCTTYREAIRNWNMTIQYWLAVNIYKIFPWKMYRMHVTMLVSTIWHGTEPGFYLCICTGSLVLAVENIYDKLYHPTEGTGTLFKVYQWIHWLLKMHFFSYQMIAREFLYFGPIFQYYNSVYHMGVIVGAVLCAVGWYLLKVKEGKKKLAAEMEEHKLKKS